MPELLACMSFCLSQRFRQKMAGRPVLRNSIGRYSEPHVFISAHISPMAGSGLFCHSKCYVLGGPAALSALGTRGVRFVIGIGADCIQHRTFTESTIPVLCLFVFLECGVFFLDRGTRCICFRTRRLDHIFDFPKSKS